MAQRRRHTQVWSWVLTCFIFLLQWGLFEPDAFAQTGGNSVDNLSELPTVLSPMTGEDGSATNVLLPDWNSISFSTMPVIQESGSVDLGQYTADVGYDLSRTWQAGATPDQYLKMGDISESLRPQDFTLGNIAQITNIDLDQVSLSAFSLAAIQTVAELAEKVPFLKDLPIREIAPIAALLLEKAVTVSPDQTIGEALETVPEIGEYRLDDIDLDQYPVTSIPNLDTVQMGEFSQWQNAFLREVPGLGDVPLTQFPSPLVTQPGIVARIDQIYGPSEAQRQRTISGSTEAGFSVPCDQDCSYIELDDLENSGVNPRAASEGHQWISGKYQLVPGGHGVLGQTNNGLEPTGRHPFGDAFKVVVWEPDETTDTVTTNIFFRYCNDPFGCTPYFIGPVPFFTYSRDSIIFLGVLDLERPSVEASTPTGANRTPGNPAGTQVQSPDIPCTTGTGSPIVAAGSLRGVNLQNLNEAIAARESSGDYAAVGTYGCDADGLCGRAMGRYQFMQYNEYASTLISQKSGGNSFLQQVRDGHNPSSEEVMQFFPPADQEQARQGWFQHLVNKASNEVDPRTGQPFQGSRLIERVGQMHNGGEYIPVDATAVQEYGSDITQRYQALGGSNAAVQQVFNTLPGGCVAAPQVAQATPPKPKPPTPTPAATPKPAATPARRPTQQQQAQRAKGRATGRYARPVDAPISSGFGYRVHPIHGDRRLHSGVDYGAEAGVAVRAADGGRVVEVVNSCTVGDSTCGGGYGNYVVIDHGNGRQTLYAHLVTDSVSHRVQGQVEKGEMVGRVGSTGWSTGPHLHFETLEKGEPVDPISTYGL